MAYSSGRPRSVVFARCQFRYDASGSVVRNNGFGGITGVRPARTLQLVTRLIFWSQVLERLAEVE
jgi:hypothetical protein